MPRVDDFPFPKVGYVIVEGPPKIKMGRFGRKCLHTGQLTYTPERTPSDIRPYDQGLLTIGFPLIRPS